MGRDAAFSAALSGGTGAIIGTLVRGAPERAAKRLVGEITDGVPANMRDKIVGKAGVKGATEANNWAGAVVQEMRRSPAIKAARGNNNAMVEAIDGEISPIIGKMDDWFKASGQVTGGINARKPLEAIHKIADGLESEPGTRRLGEAIRGQADDVYKTWIAPKSVKGEGFVMGTRTSPPSRCASLPLMSVTSPFPVLLGCLSRRATR